MSYSFNVKAATKAALLDSVAEKFNECLSNQTAHEVDGAAARAAAGSLIALANEPDEGNELLANVWGSIWAKDNGAQSLAFHIEISQVAKGAQNS